MEHFEAPDAIQALRRAKYTLKPGGRVVITMPHDGRGTPEHSKKMYGPGSFAYHHRKITRSELLEWIHVAGLRETHVADIVYPWGVTGSGIVCEAASERVCEAASERERYNGLPTKESPEERQPISVEEQYAIEGGL